jgi:hypothetical protein
MNGSRSFIVPAPDGSAQGPADKGAISFEHCRCGGGAMSSKAAHVNPVSQKSLTVDRAPARPPIESVPIRGSAGRGAVRGHRAHQLPPRFTSILLASTLVVDFLGRPAV